jgi:hypothetical protein
MATTPRGRLPPPAPARPPGSTRPSLATCHSAESNHCRLWAAAARFCRGAGGGRGQMQSTGREGLARRCCDPAATGSSRPTWFPAALPMRTFMRRACRWAAGESVLKSAGRATDWPGACPHGPAVLAACSRSTGQSTQAAGALVVWGGQDSCKPPRHPPPPRTTPHRRHSSPPDPSCYAAGWGQAGTAGVGGLLDSVTVCGGPWGHPHCPGAMTSERALMNGRASGPGASCPSTDRGSCRALAAQAPVSAGSAGICRRSR